MDIRRALACTAAFGLLLLSTGCGAPGSAKAAGDIAANARVWPQPPAQARIRYLRSFSGPGDLGITNSIFQRMADALAGRGDEHFVRPTGVAEQNGIVYVADPGARALWILDSAHNRAVKLDEIGGERFVSPVAVAVRADGAVYVADSALKKVLLVDPQGKLIQTISGDILQRPAALAFDAKNARLYVADSVGHQVTVYSAEGELLETLGRAGTRDGEFNYPTHLALERNGTLLVTDALNFRIQAFDAHGPFLWKLGHNGDGSGDLAAPKGVAVDSAGHVYVVDALFDAVQIFERDGTFLLGFGEQGRQAGQFWLPGGLFINTQDQIFVADAYNRRVQVFAGVADAHTESAK